MSLLKFSVATDLTLFKALQKFGKLSFDKLSKKSKIPKTTIQYAYERICERKFFHVTAQPRLECFPELPVALISFEEVNPIRLKSMEKTYKHKEEVRMWITDKDKLFCLLMDESKDKLTELIFAMMKKAQARPILHMLSPKIAKCDLRIPDKILDALFES